MKYHANKALAEALKAAKKVSDQGVIEHSAIDSKLLTILNRAGYLTPVIRGWSLFTKPEAADFSSVWCFGFWSFVHRYLQKRFGRNGYCLSADASVDLHTGDNQLSRQITVITKKPSNQRIDLPENTSLFLYSDSTNYPTTVQLNGINVMSLPQALCRLSPGYFKTKPLNAEIALKMLATVSDVSRVLLENAMVTDAGRLAGAYRAISDDLRADQIVKDMAAVGLAVSEVNPFENQVPNLRSSRIKSAYAGRIEAMWKNMREPIISIFPNPPGISSLKEERIIKVIMDRYKHDAYHSLSIEGYQVTEDLIQKIAAGTWEPEVDSKDQEQISAMAAKGYHDAFNAVLDSIRRTVGGESVGSVFERDLQNWYRALFSPSVRAGILTTSDLVGYRNVPVYIKGARHIPPTGKDAVVDSMEALFELLKNENHPAVRAVLGHFIFVYVHPYMDGNGRIGRFILNLMLVSGGYSWAVIKTENRMRYMQALDAASSEGRIEPFAEFILSELKPE